MEDLLLVPTRAALKNLPSTWKMLPNRFLNKGSNLLRFLLSQRLSMYRQRRKPKSATK